MLDPAVAPAPVVAPVLPVAVQCASCGAEAVLPAPRGKLPAYVERCGSSSYLVAWRRDDGSPVHEARRLYCGSWRCPSCSRHLSRKWFRRIEAVPGLTHQITLTIDQRKETLAGRSPEDVERVLVRRFARLVQRARRHFGAFEYLSVGEWHRSGWPHLHVLVRDGPGISPAEFKHWLSRPLPEPLPGARTKSDEYEGAAVECDFGPVAWVTPVRDAEGAAGYVMSHVTKAYQLRCDYSKGFRRIRCSRRFFEGVVEEEKSEVLAHRLLDGQKLEAVVEQLKRACVPIVSETSREVFDPKGEMVAMSLSSVEYVPPAGPGPWNLFDRPPSLSQGLFRDLTPEQREALRREAAVREREQVEEWERLRLRGRASPVPRPGFFSGVIRAMEEVRARAPEREREREVEREELAFLARLERERKERES